MLKSSSGINNRSKPWQSMIGVFVVIFFFIVSFLLLSFGISKDSGLHKTQQETLGIFSYIGHFISSPSESISESISNFSKAYSNINNASAIADENKILRQWKIQADKLQAENISLRRLLKVAPVMNNSDLTAKVFGNVAGPYRRQLQIYAGENNGVKKDMAVVDADGFVGRVISVGNSISQVLMITDMNSRIAVVLGKTREHAIVKGSGNKQVGLHYLPEDTKVRLGEMVYTSGDGGLIPPGILVGTVTKVTDTGVFVSPAINPTRLDYVRLMVAK